MLEARIQQLQSDVVLDVQHSKVQFIKAPSYGRGVSSGRGPKTTPGGEKHQEKVDIPKSGQTVACKSQPSRWMEKLSREKKVKLKKQQNLLQKTVVKEKTTAKSKSTTKSLMSSGTTHKTISAGAKKSRGDAKSSDEISAVISSTATAAAATAAANTTALPQNVTKQKRQSNKKKYSGPEMTGEELGEIEELERRLAQQQRQPMSQSNAESLQECKEEGESGVIQLNVRSYLEACVFVGDIQRAHRFLQSQHRSTSRRKHLNTGIYNILMRVWSKKVSSRAECRKLLSFV